MAIIFGGAIFSLVAILVLLFVSWQADKNLIRASTAQRHLELLISLSGRVSDYGLVAMEAVQAPGARPGQLESGHARVADIFQGLDSVISDQVGFVASDDARSRAATKSLIVARMEAQFEALHTRLLGLAGPDSAESEKVALTRSAMEAFGVNFAPLLAQALENERSDARRAREDMATLRNRVSVFAVIWVLGGGTLAIVLYLAAGRPILSRVAETVEGARAISSGKLDERLAPSGHDELTLLMTRFNRMADKLARRENRLLAAQRGLKRTVAARTAALRAANTRLEEIDTNRRRFFSDISHELRTPLTVILGEAEVSLRHRGGRSDASFRRAFRTIQARARTLRRRVDDLLRVARSESGRLDLVFEDGDMNLLVKEAVSDVAQLARRLRVTVDFKRKPGVLRVSCDKEWLRQVVTGLVINSLKYSPEGTSVHVAAGKRKDRAIITIRDQGYGIAPEDLPHIFERFYRGRNRPDREVSGYGVGLALVKWVVSEHHGKITVKSPAGRQARARGSEQPGTAVTVELPLTPSPEKRGSRP